MTEGRSVNTTDDDRRECFWLKSLPQSQRTERRARSACVLCVLCVLSLLCVRGMRTPYVSVEYKAVKWCM